MIPMPSLRVTIKPLLVAALLASLAILAACSGQGAPLPANATSPPEPAAPAAVSEPQKEAEPTVADAATTPPPAGAATEGVVGGASPPPAFWQIYTLLAPSVGQGRLYALLVNDDGDLLDMPRKVVRFLVSDDWGETWSPFPGGLPVNSDCINGVNLNQATNDELYVSTCQGVYVWEQGGWVKRSDQVTNAIAVPPSQPQVIWAADPETNPREPVIRSDDGGQTWSLASEGLLSFRGIARLAVDPLDSATLYAIIRPRYGGSYLRRVTAEGGWQTMPTPLENTTIEINLAIDPASGDLYLVTQTPTSQLWRTTDPRIPNVDEVSWELVHDFGREHRATILAAGQGPQGLALFANLRTLNWLSEEFAYAGWPVLHRSLDGGQTWQPLLVQ